MVHDSSKGAFGVQMHGCNQQDPGPYPNSYADANPVHGNFTRLRLAEPVVEIIGSVSLLCDLFNPQTHETCGWLSPEFSPLGSSLAGLV